MSDFFDTVNEKSGSNNQTMKVISVHSTDGAKNRMSIVLYRHKGHPRCLKKCQAEFLGIRNLSYANELIQRLQLDPRANLKRMSKGMKQKTALVAALMNDSPVIILDEPTTGLDPLMRVTFLDIIKEEHRKGKTIFMSSHSFEELEKTCDKVALISDGHIADVCTKQEISERPIKEFKIEFNRGA